MLELVVKFLMIFGIPILIAIFAIIILVNVVVIPRVRTAKAEKIYKENVIVRDKRKTVRYSINGDLTEYYISVLVEDEITELKCSKGVYKKVNFDDVGNMVYKPGVELITSFNITKKSGNKTKGRYENLYSFSGNGVYKR